MFGSIILDIVIGLVFIFLLYSLLATIINEIIATFLGLRARNLRTAIWRMLENSPPSKKEMDWREKTIQFLKDIWFSFFGIFSSKNGKLLKEFYNQPTIKYLANSSFFSKPSYINPSDFSKSILDILKSEGDGTKDLDKIKNALNQPYGRVELIKAVEKLINEGETLDEAQKINAIKQVIKQKHKNIKLFDGETRSHVLSLLNDAQDDLVKFRIYLENWFDNTMDRAVGWYKRKTQLNLLIIGFIIAALFNINIIEIAKKLSKDKDARDQMVQMATSYIENNPNIVQNLDSLAKTDNLYRQKIDTLLAIRKDLEKDINDANELLAISRPPKSIEVKIIDMDSLKSEHMDSLKSEQIIIYFSKQAYVPVSSKDKVTSKDGKYYKIKDKGNEESTYAYFSWRKYILVNGWGFLITALAISLGASFWFDLLNKIVKLRNSLQQKTPEQNGKSATQVLEVPVIQREG